MKDRLDGPMYNSSFKSKLRKFIIANNIRVNNEKRSSIVQLDLYGFK